jgi:predicted enzyme related to lactoylglutathione lyase
MVKDLAFVAYSVKDAPTAAKFYRDVIGLEPGEEFGDHWIEFNVGTTAFGVGNGEGLGLAPGSSSGAAFEVDDLVAMRDHLLAHGVRATEIHDFPSGCAACFAWDPDGNQFALHQKRR